ncbi:MAG: ABC transporter ATP-binding protein [Dethiobacter sp.]|jgi:ATP-binding cassette subfamily B protein|nr:ABC transporter ATP-binding protein [Dethiobacter sp.]MBS3901733.1 ABC transporter ATP-binding protein [Dethiobacter sp.]MBS3990249.1 ABC transporter ATP-binding protein [Dethiobacter sp.]
MEHMIHQSQTIDHAAPIDPKVLRRLFSYIIPFRGTAFLALILMAFSSLTTLAGPYIVKVAIDTAIAGGDLSRLNLLVFLFLLAHLLNWLASFGQQYLMAYVGHNAVYSLRRELFNHLQRLPFRFFDKQPTGRVMSRVTNDTEALTEMISGGISHIVGDTLLLFGIVVIMLREDWQLALLTFTTLPLLFFTATYFRNRVLRAYRTVREKIADVNSNLQESISGVRVTQSFTREEENSSRFDQVNMESYAANLYAIRLFSVFLPFIEVIGALGIAIVLWYGGNQVVQAMIPIGTLYLFLDYTARFYAPIRDLSQVYNGLQSALAAGEKIFTIIDTEAEQDQANAIELADVKGDLQFEAVRFAYEKEQDVLKGVSFVLRAGESLAVVGPTGAGKTTLVNLLCRFYTATSGRILLDGHDIANVSISSLRKQMGLVLQDTFLFNGTIRENILYGKPEADEDAVLAAAKAVHAHSFIMALPQGYDTVVNERGSLLSAGQRQLIAFARALLRDPAILILDEATASVDTRTEAHIQDALKILLKNRTSIIIAHRLSTVEFADKIIVLEDGCITQEGTHRELASMPGLYRRLLQRTQ